MSTCELELDSCAVNIVNPRMDKGYFYKIKTNNLQLINAPV